MDRLIATNSVPFASADTAPETGTPQYATSGNPATATPATIFPAYAWNTLQDEIYNVIVGAGLTPDRTKWNQLITAIQTLIQQGGSTYATDTSATANQIIAALTPAPTALQDGMGVLVKLANSITGATTLNLNSLGAEPVLGLYGVALQGGEGVAGGFAYFRWSADVSSWILVWAQDGALQIPPGTKSSQAVQFGQLGNFQGVVAVSANYAIPSTGFGYVYQPPTGNAGGFTITLPSPTNNGGKALAIFNSSSGNLTLSAGNFNTAYGNGTSIVLPPNSTAILCCDGVSYNGIGGSAGAGAGIRPQGGSGVGQLGQINYSGSGSNCYYQLPAGGTWAYWVSNNGVSTAGVAAGGTVVMSGFTASFAINWVWRIA
jgi:hypothetical protein